LILGGGDGFFPVVKAASGSSRPLTS